VARRRFFSPIVKVAVVFLAALLAGCVTAYQPHSLTGGYKDRLVGTSRHYVEFYGNGNTTRDTVFAYWLYRCAELTHEKGFDYFVLISRTPPSGAAVEPEDVETVPVRTPSRAPVYTYVPGHTSTTWSARGVIELRKGQPGEMEDRPSYVAKELLSALGPAVRQAMAAGGNVTLPPRFSLADEPSSAAQEQRRGPVKLEDLDALLPK
jgi:hypothetical protein